MDADLSADDALKFYLLQFAFAVFVAGLLLLISWRYGQPRCEERFDPIKAANEERDAIIQERDDALRAWAVMGTKHERAIERIVNLEDEASKSFKDLPFLTESNYKLSEENTVQYNEIERLKIIQQQYDNLMRDVSAYGMPAKRPEKHQQECESLQRRLMISNCHLQKVEETAKVLKDMLKTQKETADKEKDWLRAMLKKNARSSAYWAKSHRSDDRKLAWGVRCACTESEAAYSLKDQTLRIVKLEGIIGARDETISRLRTRRGNVREDDSSSQPNATKDKEIDDLRTEKRLAEENAETRISSLEQKLSDSRKILVDVRQIATEREKGLGRQKTRIDELEANQSRLEDIINQKNVEIGELEEANQQIAEQPAQESAETLHRLAMANTNLEELRRQYAECQGQSETQSARINELEANKSQLEDTIEQKNAEIQELEAANQEMAEQPAQESAETLHRLAMANTNLEELRRQYAECQGQSETQSARINELEATQRRLEDTVGRKDDEITTAKSNLDELRRQYAEYKGQSEAQSTKIRELEAGMTLKDNRIAVLEGQISTAPTTNDFELQRQSHADAIFQKDQVYQALRDLHNQTLNQQQLAQTKYNENLETLNVVQQNYNTKVQEFQRLWIVSQDLHNAHSDCDNRMNDLAGQLRQSGSANTDLQVKNNTQSTELDAANQTVDELRSKLTTLQQANATLQQRASFPESDVERYRLEGEDRVRLNFQATFDREMSAQALKLEDSQGTVFKLQNQLQQANNLASPLREMQLKSREDAVRAREDALKQQQQQQQQQQDPDDDAMDHDHQGGQSSSEDAQRELKSLQTKLSNAKKEVGDGRLRITNYQRQLTKEKKERKEDKERHERELKREKDDAEQRGKVLKLRLEAENPLKGTVSKLQKELAVLKNALKERD